MRFVELSWLVISLASHRARNNHACGEKSATSNLILSGNRGAQASAPADGISRVSLHFQDLHGPAAKYVACFSLDPGRAKGRRARTQEFRCPASSFLPPPPGVRVG